MNAKVAKVMAEGNWRDSDSGEPIDEDAVGSLVNHLNHLLELFSFSTGSVGVSPGCSPTPVGPPPVPRCAPAPFVRE